MVATGRAVAVLAVLVVAALAPGAAANPFVQQPGTDSTVTRIALHENATATWAVQVRTRLRTDESVADYEAFQERFRENTSAFLDPFAEQMTGVVANAANTTGRPMQARDFEASTSIQPVPRRWGIVTYRFDWTDFAEADGNALVVGDVFRGRFYLTANDSLSVTGPDAYVLAEARPEPEASEQRRVRWEGERSFADNRPYARFDPATTTSPTGATATDEGPGPTGDGADGRTATVDGTATDGRAADGGATDGSGAPGGTTVTDGGNASSLPLVALALVPIGLLAVGAYRYYWGDQELPDRAAGDDPTDAGDASASARTDGVPNGEGSESSDAASTAGAEAADAAAGTDASGSEPTAILTDERRVERLLAEEGGQLKQSDIVDRLGWSKSKTSRVLSGMAEDDEIEKLRIGRENVIRLPEAAEDDEF